MTTPEDVTPPIPELDKGLLAQWAIDTYLDVGTTTNLAREALLSEVDGYLAFVKKMPDTATSPVFMSPVGLCLAPHQSKVMNIVNTSDPKTAPLRDVRLVERYNLLCQYEKALQSYSGKDEDRHKLRKQLTDIIPRSKPSAQKRNLKD